ncbi:hypothetical protein [Xanthobacter sediminis]
MGDVVSAPAPAPTWALKAAIGLGLVADAALVVLLLAVSGSVFGGPEGTDGAFAAIAGWSGALAVCILAPLVALFLWRRGQRDVAIATVWLPIVALLVGIAIGSF